MSPLHDGCRLIGRDVCFVRSRAPTSLTVLPHIRLITPLGPSILQPTTTSAGRQVSLTGRHALGSFRFSHHSPVSAPKLVPPVPPSQDRLLCGLWRSCWCVPRALRGSKSQARLNATGTGRQPGNHLGRQVRAYDPMPVWEIGDRNQAPGRLENNALFQSSMSLASSSSSARELSQAPAPTTPAGSSGTARKTC